MLEIFQYGFLLRALVVGLLVSLCAALLGVSLVLKRFSMIGDGLSHVGFGALAIASALNLAPLQVSIPVVIVAAFILLRISSDGKIKGDAAIALLSSSALAIGAIVISQTNSATDMNSYGDKQRRSCAQHNLLGYCHRNVRLILQQDFRRDL